MPLIKRYANRKLYHTELRKYISLETIAEMVREGKTFQVVENDTGKDVTTQMLAQIILERERKKGDGVPRSVLELLIQLSHQSMREIQTKLHTPFENIEQINKEMRLRIQDLIHQGEIAEAAGKQLLIQFNDYLRQICISSLVDPKSLTDTMDKLGIPTRGEFESLTRRVEDLNTKISLIQREQEH
jgi:polyhydroxyalkanoate synthesis repressor PhaR